MFCLIGASLISWGAWAKQGSSTVTWDGDSGPGVQSGCRWTGSSHLDVRKEALPLTPQGEDNGCSALGTFPGLCSSLGWFFFWGPQDLWGHGSPKQRLQRKCQALTTGLPGGLPGELPGGLPGHCLTIVCFCRIFDLQYCVSFRCTLKWFRCVCVCICIYISIAI